MAVYDLQQHSDDRPTRIGISTCLLGEKVRFDGGHKHDRFLTDILGRYMEFVPSCPEVDIGLSIPRPSLRLQRQGEEVRMVMPKTGDDVTRKMRAYAKTRVAALAKEDLCGYVLKNRSPSCGIKVRTYTTAGMPAKSSPGMFAEELMARCPNLPITEEGRLRDAGLRENWIERVFAYHRLRCLWATRWSIGDLVAFHTAHKYLLLAHSPKTYKDLGQLVAAAKSVPRAELRERYETEFMQGLAKMATAKRNVNVLHHMLGFFKRDLDTASRHELLEHIEDYRRELIPLIVPITLIKHYVRILDVEYLRDQVYLNPHPKELALRNHV
jgi:uncharacterized protein YbgA (DUF1722 family)/uncharacterized protein YbbK (DUF523 family)